MTAERPLEHAPAASCPFCRELDRGALVAERGQAAAVRDSFPVAEGHLLVIPRRHVAVPFDLTAEEARDVWGLVQELRRTMADEDSRIEGFNVGFNAGEVAGQTVGHAHIHLIPRRDGDTPNPRGGVRGVIPARMSY